MTGESCYLDVSVGSADLVDESVADVFSDLRSPGVVPTRRGDGDDVAPLGQNKHLPFGSHISSAYSLNSLVSVHSFTSDLLLVFLCCLALSKLAASHPTGSSSEQSPEADDLLSAGRKFQRPERTSWRLMVSYGSKCGPAPGL